MKENFNKIKQRINILKRIRHTTTYTEYGILYTFTDDRYPQFKGQTILVAPKHAKQWDENDNIKPCEICGQLTSFERFHQKDPHEGERTTCCDRWICADCVCWVDSDDSLIVCKDCCKCCEDEDLYSSSNSSSFSYNHLNYDDFFEYTKGDKILEIIAIILKYFLIIITILIVLYVIK